MPTVGRIAANLIHKPLAEIVKSTNLNGNFMKQNGALTKTGNKAYQAGKAKLGLPANASVIDCIEAAKKQASITAKVVKNEIQKAIKKGGFNIN